jgi:hypothetical protein
MKIPKTLKIGGRDYEILSPHIFKDAPRTLYGLHDPGTQTIKLAQKDEFGVDRHPQGIKHTFMHEMIHAIDNVYFGGKLTAWECGENAVDQLAEGLLQVIQDNGLDFRKEK